MILHHEQLVCHHEHTRFLDGLLILKALIKTDPLWVKVFTFLPKRNHSWEQNSILSSDRALNVEKGNIVMRYVSLGSL